MIPNIEIITAVIQPRALHLFISGRASFAICNLLKFDWFAACTFPAKSTGCNKLRRLAPHPVVVPGVQRNGSFMNCVPLPDMSAERESVEDQKHLKHQFKESGSRSDSLSTSLVNYSDSDEEDSAHQLSPESTSVGLLMFDSEQGEKTFSNLRAECLI